MKGAQRTGREVVALPLPLLVNLVNAWGSAPRKACGKSAQAYSTLSAWRATSPLAWRQFPRLSATQLVEVADLVYPVFAAGSGRECAQSLSRLAEQAGLTPTMASEGWRVREAWRCAHAGQELLAAAALALLEHLRASPDASRLGTCHGQACADVFVDQSPAGLRQFCSLTCQTRQRTRAYRAGKRETEARSTLGA